MKQLQNSSKPSWLTPEKKKKENKGKKLFLYTITTFPDNFSSLLSFCEIPYIFNIWKAYKD